VENEVRAQVKKKVELEKDAMTTALRAEMERSARKELEQDKDTMLAEIEKVMLVPKWALRNLERI
jgi:hypothetical protein